jgi:phenylacetate-CoA ligase
MMTSAPKQLIEDIERMSNDEVTATVDMPLLGRQLRYVLNSSPPSQERIRSSGMAPEDAVHAENLQYWPLVSKTDALAEQAAHPPYGRLATRNGIRDVLRIHVTSGTSGTPLYIALTRRDVADNVTSGRRAFLCAGLSPSDTVVHCLNYCLWAGGITDHLSLEATGATVIPFGVGNTKRLLETIQALRPNAISCTPSYMARLEVVLKDELGLSPRDLRLSKGFFGGEGGLQNAEVRAAIEETWGIQAIDANYGMADVMSIFGSECEMKQGLHFHGRGLLHVALLRPGSTETVPVQAGAEGELVLTNLRRQAQPLVRYRTGDVVRITGCEPCLCGRASFRFVVVCRADDMIVVRGINVYASAVKALLARYRDILGGAFEIVLGQRPLIDPPLLRVELLQSHPAGASGHLAGILGRACHDELQFTPRVELVPFGTLPRTEGKARWIRRTDKQRGES